MSEDSRSERESELDEESSNDQNNVENIFIFKRCKCKQYIGISGKEEKGGEGGGGGYDGKSTQAWGRGYLKSVLKRKRGQGV